MTAQALLFILSAIGIAETVYLLQKRMTKESPVCIIGQECHKVLESKYNKLAGIPNEALGLLFYVITALITIFSVIGIGPTLRWKSLLEILIFAGTAASLGLVYLQWRIIKSWCFWCLMSAVTIFLMLIVALLS